MLNNMIYVMTSPLIFYDLRVPQYKIACQLPSIYIFVGRLILLNTVRNGCFGGGCFHISIKALNEWTGTSYLDTQCTEVICLIIYRALFNSTAVKS